MEIVLKLCQKTYNSKLLFHQTKFKHYSTAAKQERLYAVASKNSS